MKKLYTLFFLTLHLSVFAASVSETDPPTKDLLDCSIAPVVSVTQPTCLMDTGNITITAPIGNNYEYSVNGGMTYQSSTSFLGLAANNSYPVLYRDINTSCVSAVTTVVINENTQPGLTNQPAVQSSVFYCQNAAASPLLAVGSNLLWYTTPTGGVGVTATPIPSTAIVGTFFYFVSQTVNGCESARSVITVTIAANMSLNLFCDPSQTTADSLTFDWVNIPGASLYVYAYSIAGAPAISGSLSSPTNFTVSGLTAGQSVVFGVSVAGNPCVPMQTATCTLPPLAAQDFERQMIDYYPNPVKGIFNIESQETINYLSVFNLLGQQVVGQSVNESKFQIDFSHLAPTVYIVKVDVGNNSKVIRIVKQ